MAVSFIGGGNRRKPLTNFITVLYRTRNISGDTVMGTDCIGRCKSKCDGPLMDMKDMQVQNTKIK